MTATLKSSKGPGKLGLLTLVCSKALIVTFNPLCLTLLKFVAGCRLLIRRTQCCFSVIIQIAFTTHSAVSIFTTV